MEIAQHADRCITEFGKAFYEVHNFLDQHYQEYGLAHRRLFHHRLGVELIVKRFGKAAHGPVERHICQDTGGELPEDWSFYGDPLPLLLELVHNDRQEAQLRKEKQDAELLSLYGEEAFQRIQSRLRKEMQGLSPDQGDLTPTG